MTFIQIIQNVRDLIAAVQASNWSTALSIIIAFLTALSGSTPPIRMAAASPADAAEATACVAELQKCCDDMAAKKQALSAGDISNLIADLLPIILKYVKIWLGA